MIQMQQSTSDDFYKEIREEINQDVLCKYREFISKKACNCGSKRGKPTKK